MARSICMKPCPATVIYPGVTIPLMGTKMSASPNFTLQGGCDGCEAVGNLMLQLNPVLGSMGIPLCLLKCLGAVIGGVKAVPDSLGPPPDPTKLGQAIANMIAKCECLLQFALPPPAGAICDFLHLLFDVCFLIATLLTCVIGLVQHLITLNLKASLKLGSPIAAINSTGVCLAAQVQIMMDALNGKMATVQTILAVIQPIIEVLSAVTPPPFSTLMTQLSNGFAIFSGSVPIGTPPGSFLTSILTLQTIVNDVVSGLGAVVAICP